MAFSRDGEKSHRMHFRGKALVIDSEQKIIGR